MIVEFDDDDDVVVRTTSRAEEAADFLAATTFEGQRPGFVFHRGDRGLGYYRDTAVPAVEAVVKAPAAKKARSVRFAPTERSVDAMTTVERLCKAAAAASKRGKALGMLVSAADAGALTATTTPVIVTTLGTLARAGPMDEALVPAFGALVDRLAAAPLASADRASVVTWTLSSVTARRLRDTDDTYEYAAAMKRLRAAIAALRPQASARAAARRDAVLHCLHAAARPEPWAKSQFEAGVLAAAKKRTLFDDRQRGSLDALTTKVVKRDGGRPGPVVARRAEVAYHPLRTVKRRIAPSSTPT